MLGVQPVFNVVLMLDVELAVLFDLHLRVAVHTARRGSTDPSAVDIVDAPVARAEKLPLRVHDPAHRAPQVGAGVGEDIDSVHQLLALLLREPFTLLVHEVGAQAPSQLVTDGPLPARRLDLVPPREPDGVPDRELRPLADPALLRDLPVPVGLTYRELDREVGGRFFRYLRDRPNLPTDAAHDRLA